MAQTIHCQNCQTVITTGLLCLVDVDTMRRIHAELPGWALELADRAATGLRGVDYSAVRVSGGGFGRPLPFDLELATLARQLGEAGAAWSRELGLLAKADARVVAVWEAGPACHAAMVRAEAAALAVLDPAELQRRRDVRHRAQRARQGRPGPRPATGARPAWERLDDALSGR